MLKNQYCALGEKEKTKQTSRLKLSVQSQQVDVFQLRRGYTSEINPRYLVTCSPPAFFGSLLGILCFFFFSREIVGENHCNL